MNFSENSEYKYMSIDDLYLERENISFLMVEAEGSDLEQLELNLEEIEELITLKEAGADELNFD